MLSGHATGWPFRCLLHYASTTLMGYLFQRETQAFSPRFHRQGPSFKPRASGFMQDLQVSRFVSQCRTGFFFPVLEKVRKGFGRGLFPTLDHGPVGSLAFLSDCYSTSGLYYASSAQECPRHCHGIFVRAFSHHYKVGICRSVRTDSWNW